jgi:hypothetical protein
VPVPFLMIFLTKDRALGFFFFLNESVGFFQTGLFAFHLCFLNAPIF